MRKVRLWFSTTALAALVIGGSTVVEGRWSGRWGDVAFDDLQRLVEVLDDLPMHVVDPATGQAWDGAQLDVDRRPDEEKLAGAVGLTERAYRPAKGLAAPVTLMWLCGPARNVAVHSPDACYPAAGFKMEGEPQSFRMRYRADATAEPVQAEFKTAVFARSAPAGPERVRIFWTWNGGGTWEAPDYPRMRFGGQAPLNKIYLVAAAPRNQAVEESPCMTFARALLPAADRALAERK